MGRRYSCTGVRTRLMTACCVRFGWSGDGSRQCTGRIRSLDCLGGREMAILLGVLVVQVNAGPSASSDERWGWTTDQAVEGGAALHTGLTRRALSRHNTRVQHACTIVVYVASGIPRQRQNRGRDRHVHAFTRQGRAPSGRAS